MEETDVEMVVRLQSNWDRHGQTIGEALKRLVNSMESGSDLHISGIDRDLIVYAMARVATMRS